METERGVKWEPQRIILTGPEGIGKTTLASKLPDPIFIDVEGSTADLDVVRVSHPPKSWQALLDLTAEFAKSSQGFASLIIDTADWCEKLAITHVCAGHHLSALGGQDDYGRSYNLLEQEWCRWLDLLSRVARKGMHVCLLAHTKMRSFSLPDQDGSFDRYELKLEKKTAAATKEWARTMLFLNYKTYVVKEKGAKTRATGGHRVMYSTHHVCWDAKNRCGLPDEMPLEYASIEHLFRNPGTLSVRPADPPKEPARDFSQKPELPGEPDPARPSYFEPLYQLMERDKVSYVEIQLAVGKRGIYPADYPIEKYDEETVSGRLVAHWPKVLDMVNKVRQEIAQ